MPPEVVTFVVRTLVGDLRDDAVLAPEARFQHLDLRFQLLLLAVLPSRRLQLQHLSSLIEELPLPLLEDAGLELVLLAQIRHGDLVGQMAAKDRGLILGGELAALTSTHEDSFQLRSVEQTGVAFQLEQYKPKQRRLSCKPLLINDLHSNSRI